MDLKTVRDQETGLTIRAAGAELRLFGTSPDNPVAQRPVAADEKISIPLK